MIPTGNYAVHGSTAVIYLNNPPVNSLGHATRVDLSAHLQEATGKPFVADNRPGAATMIGTTAVAKAPPDGYTLLLGTTGPLANNPLLYAKLPYDSLKDFVPVTLVGRVPFMLVIHPSVAANSVRELVALAKANPGKLNFGSSGNNTLQHFAGEMLNHLAGIKISHIPYKGTAAVIPAMMAGEVQVGYGSLIGTRPQMQAGRLRGIAITAAKRSPSIDLPTVAESGVPGYEVDQWYGVITSSRVPQSIVKKLSDAMIEGLQQPETAARLAGDGSIPVGSSPAQFTAHIKSEIAKWKRLVKESSLKMEK